MKAFRSALLAGAAIPAASLATGALAGGTVVSPVVRTAQNPCAAKNPCAAGNPCAAAAPVELTAAEAKAVYACLRGEMEAGYARSGNKHAKAFVDWKQFATQPYATSRRPTARAMRR